MTVHIIAIIMTQMILNSFDDILFDIFRGLLARWLAG